MNLRTFLFYLFVFLLPWQTRYIMLPIFVDGAFFEYGTWSVYATEILLWAFIFLSLFRFQRISFHDADIFLLLFFGGAVVFAFWSFALGISFFALIRLIEGVLLFFAVRTVKINWTHLCAILLISGIMQALFAFLQIGFQEVYGSVALGISHQNPQSLGVSIVGDGLGGRFLRAYGSLPHPNILGGFLLPPIGAAVMLYIRLSLRAELQRGTYRFSPKILRVCFVVLVFALFLTFSRSAVIAFALMLGIYIAVIYKKAAQRIIKVLAFDCALMTIFVAGMFFVVFHGSVLNRIEAGGALEKRSISERVGEIRKLPLDRRSLLGYGAGIGNYAYRAALVSSEANRRFTQPVHNAYLLGFLEAGIVNALFFIYFLFLAWIRALKKVNTVGIDFLLPFAAMSGLLAINFFDHYLWTLYPGIMLFWVVIGLAGRGDQ